MTELCFVLAPGQNHFFVEVAEALTFELEQLGVPVGLSREGFPPPRDDLVYVLVPPHEYRWLAPRSQWPTPRELERTIFYCLEQPGTSYFDEDVRMGRGPVGAVLDVNELSAREQRRRGVLAHHAPLGWTAAWSHADPAAPERDVDLLHLGIYSPRRGRALARSAHALARRRTKLVLGDDHRPNASSQANFAIDRDKWELLGRSRVLLNVHVGDRSYFEWLRVVQAICNGVLVVSEHSTGTAPLRAGEHFVSGRADALVELAEPLLEDEPRREEMAHAAATALREQQPLGGSAVLLAELADEVARRPAGTPHARQGALMLAESGGDPGVEQAAALARTVALRGPAGTPLEPPAPPEDDRAADFSGGPVELLSDPACEWLPGGLARLTAALDDDPSAAFAWGMVADEDGGDEGPALRNAFPWQPWRLADGSYIDRPVLWRAAALRELGIEIDTGQTGPDGDLDLYRRAADRGLRGAHVPEIVATREAADVAPLCFMHLPKTGGQSVKEELRAVLPEGAVSPFTIDSEVCRMVFDSPSVGPVDESLRSKIVGEEDLDLLRRHRYVAGHFTLPTLLRVAPASRIATVLREPRARLLSLYLFVRLPVVRDMWGDSCGQLLDAASRPLDEFLLEPRIVCSTDNHVCRMILSDDRRVPRDRPIPDRLVEAVAESALARLDRLGFVGILESGDAMWQGLSQFFGAELHPRRINESSTPAASADAEALPAVNDDAAVFDALAQRTAADRIVYEEILARTLGGSDGPDAARRFAREALMDQFARVERVRASSAA